MPAARVEITDINIEYAEKILLADGESFDEERKAFIKNLDTIDLQAVPGSGKTTALLAKLLILEKYLPFNDGTGVLVISHTNTAVDQILYKIGNYCPQLFSYPNFVGTIQSFVDLYLALPYYSNEYKKKPFRIDNEIYEEKASSFSRFWFTGFSQEEQNNAKRYLLVNDLYKDLRSTIIDEEEVLTRKLFGKPLTFNKPRGNTRSQNYVNWNDQEKEKIKQWLFEFKKRLLSDGILCFDDAYSLAMKAIIKYPQLKQLLCRRFRYVFVDEMQDMDRHQYELLENLFGVARESAVYQRIGDRNQSIYGVVKSEDIWSNEGKTILPISGSCRFSQEIAKVVQSFSLTRETIRSMATHTSIRPHILIYKDDTILNVKDKFIDIIKEKQRTGHFPHNPLHPIKAIGWRKSNDGDSNKIILRSYFPSFTEGALKTKIDYLSMLSYLTFVKKDISEASNLADYHKNIFNAILRILRFENITDNNRRQYTKRNFLNLIRERDAKEYHDLRLVLYRCCKYLHSRNIGEAHGILKQFLPVFLKEIFGKTELSAESIDFINSTSTEENQAPITVGEENKHDNIYRKDGFEVQVRTIHSAKGETHSATLYLETFYYNDGGRSYESQRLKNSFKGQFIPSGEIGVHIKESLKMAYVGMSRPTHLLCVAVHKDRIHDYIDEIPDDLWEIIEV